MQTRNMATATAPTVTITAQKIILHKNHTDLHLLHRQFVQLGRERNKITYKLLALLPKIYKARIYQIEGYATIYEYAGKLAGLSHSVVEKALKLENKLQNKPHLQKAIETQGIHKVAIVAQLATPENEQMFADKVENMSKEALQQLSKEIRMEKAGENFVKPKIKIELDDEMEFLFLKLKKEMKAKKLSNKEFLRRILKKMATKSQMMPKPRKSAATSQSAPKIPGEQARSEPATAGERSATRYIRVVTKRAALEITNGKCAHEGCNRPYEILHHQIPFSLNRTHDSIIPLCKIHHEFAHNGIAEKTGNHEKTSLPQTDILYRKYRQSSLK